MKSVSLRSVGRRRVALVSGVLFIVAFPCHGILGDVEQAGAPSPRVGGAPADVEAVEAANAARLVEQAFEAELAGDSVRRSAALSGAVAADPSHQPARWQSGQIQFDGQWRSVAETERLVAGSESAQAYRQLRDDLGDESDDHRELARWCTEHRLGDEARYHWSCVLQDDPADADARQALNVIERDGALSTREEIAQADATQKQHQENFERFAPQFRKLVLEAASGDTSLRAAALAAIRAVRDPAAMPALEQVVSREAIDRKKGPLKKLRHGAWRQLVIDLHGAMLGALGDMPQREATVDLLDYALATTWPEIREQAVDALKLRSATEYVPLLMAELAAPIEAEIEVRATLDGSVDYSERLFQAGPERDQLFIGGKTVQMVWSSVPRGQGQLGNARRLMISQRSELMQTARLAQQEVARRNAMIEARNQRVAQVLAMTAGANEQWTAQQWWGAWAGYNELSLADEPPITTTDYSYTPILTPAFTVQGMSCFPAGTLVWTKSGYLRIERIRVGDFVLAQHPATGELAYRPVIGRTVRPPSRLVRMELPGETILTTRGHRFWVAGQGWQMAKLLAAGDPLHALGGSVELAGVEPLGKDEQAEAYNLIVDDFHTYFVGANRLLVHDNGCPEPTRAALPGMSPGKDWTSRARDQDWLAAADGKLVSREN